jgi:hypothetical protein
MPDNLSDRAPADGSLISLDEDHEVAYWTKALGITPAVLGQAVAAAGNSAEAVRTWLQDADDEPWTVGGHVGRISPTRG